MLSLYMWNLKNSTSESIYKPNRNSNVENKLIIPEGEVRGINWETEADIYMLLYIK